MIPQAARFAPELNSGGRRSLLQNTGCERTDGRFKPGNSQSVKPPNLACVKILICGRGIPERAAPTMATPKVVGVVRKIRSIPQPRPNRWPDQRPGHLE